MKLTIRSGGTGHGACSDDLCWTAKRVGRRLGRLQPVATVVPQQAPRPFGRLSVGLQSKPPANRPHTPSAPRSLSLRWTDLPHRLVQSALPRSAHALTSCQSWLLKAVCPYALPQQRSVGADLTSADVIHILQIQRFHVRPTVNGFAGAYCTSESQFTGEV